MLHYPKIPGSGAAPLSHCVAFDKLDGTNLHWCWERDFGWHAFGTRRDEFDLGAAGVAAFGRAHPGLEEAVPVFRATLAEPLDALLRDHPSYPSARTVKVFTEFVGPNSFAGAHTRTTRSIRSCSTCGSKTPSSGSCRRASSWPTSGTCRSRAWFTPAS